MFVTRSGQCHLGEHCRVNTWVGRTWSQIKFIANQIKPNLEETRCNTIRRILMTSSCVGCSLVGVYNRMGTATVNTAV